jgi:arylsulfatase A-like enzyme
MIYRKDLTKGKMSLTMSRLKAILGSMVIAMSLFLAVPTSSVNAQNSRPNVVVLVLDQLRADELHCYGNPRLTSPNIDKLASRGVTLTYFFTVAPWTSPSFGTLHTSLFPSKHGVTLFWKTGMPLIDKDVPTLGEAFRDSGYHTAAFVDNSLGGKALVGEGFEDFVDGSSAAPDITQRAAGVKIGAPYTTANVLAWLDQRHGDTQPFFVYVHFLEPHSPYNPPPADDLFKSDAYPDLTNTGYDYAHGRLLRLALNGDQKAVERLYQLYDGKIHYVDGYVGQILDRLRSLGLQDNTYVLLTSDHGELLYSHPDDFLTFDHRSLYDTVLHIPLIVAGPGIPQGQTNPALASNIDTAPTLLDLAGVPPLGDAEGHSLAPLIEGKVKSGNEYIFAEEDVEIPERSVRSNDYKLIRNLWTGEEQLFALRIDPGELRDVAKENPKIVKQLEAQLDAWTRVNEPSATVQLRRWKIYTEPSQTVTVDDIGIGAAFLIRPRQEWHSDENPASGNFGGTSFWTERGDGSRTALWRGDTPLVGTYKVYVFTGNPKAGTLATNAQFKIVAEHETKTVAVNLQERAGEWRLLGTFDNPRYVELNNAADGIVVADAVRFERVGW